ncbi:MAG: YqeG family HAD IIIA-type phosphatase [Halanaerobiales bacterium]|nr:YqeG family HAD IIIA-type phosphatase [Halanaerobiales bacterium]
MLRNLRPDKYITDILKLTPSILKKMGIKGIVCDLDNTIIPWDQDDLDEEMIKWFASLKESDLHICLLSNSLHGRVNGIAKILGVDAIPAALKPRRKAFKKAMDMLQLFEGEIVVVGDQLFTDILGGNRIGFKTILVKPLAEKEFFWTCFVRRIEKWVLLHMKRKGILFEIDLEDE